MNQIKYLLWVSWIYQMSNRIDFNYRFLLSAIGIIFSIFGFQKWSKFNIFFSLSRCGSDESVAMYHVSWYEISEDSEIKSVDIFQLKKERFFFGSKRRKCFHQPQINWIHLFVLLNFRFNSRVDFHANKESTKKRYFLMYSVIYNPIQSIIAVICRWLLQGMNQINPERRYSSPKNNNKKKMPRNEQTTVNFVESAQTYTHIWRSVACHRHLSPANEGKISQIILYYRKQ